MPPTRLCRQSIQEVSSVLSEGGGSEHLVVVWTRKKKAEASVSVNCSKYPLSFPVSSLVVCSLSEFRLVHLDYHSGTTDRRRVGDEVVADSCVEDAMVFQSLMVFSETPIS